MINNHYYHNKWFTTFFLRLFRQKNAIFDMHAYIRYILIGYSFIQSYSFSKPIIFLAICNHVYPIFKVAIICKNNCQLSYILLPISMYLFFLIICLQLIDHHRCPSQEICCQWWRIR